MAALIHALPFLLAAVLLLGACGDIEDPDPCDPDCPPTTENPTGD